MNGDILVIRFPGAVALLCAFLAAGCNTRPDMPKKTNDWFDKPVKTLAVDSSNPEEVQIVTDVETVHKRYHHDLSMLLEYYEKTGNVTKGRWAKKELDNLIEAQDFTFVGITPPPDVTGTLPENAKERGLLENVTNSREEYLSNLDALCQYYEKKNDDFKSQMLQTALARFFDEETYLFMHRVEVPPEHLEPCKIIPRANELYDRALAMYKQGSTSIPFDYARIRQALGMFLRLVRQYPQSTRIASAAFYIGKIYCDFFREPYLGVEWYQRAWTWDPYMPLPARYEAGVVCQLFLRERDRALKYLKASLIHEKPYEANGKDARERIKQIEDEMEYVPPIPTPGEEPVPQPRPVDVTPTES